MGKVKYSATYKMKINRIDSLLDIVKSLILNNYEVTVKTIYQDFPCETHIDYFDVSYRMLEEIDD